LSNNELCGTRGHAAPLTGFAVRLDPVMAHRFDCVYSGRFVSGRQTGPFCDGTMCRSDLPNDPLEGIELNIFERREECAVDPISTRAASAAAELELG
jgi:hypothetical protein